MTPVHVFEIVPSLPAPLEGLRRLAYNLRWTWNHESIDLFRRLDSDLWESTGHNPVAMLGAMDQAQLEAAARDETILAQLERGVQALDSYVQSKSTWHQHHYGKLDGLLVAYFSAEFGLTECMSVFAGGLGILAGDHLKSASNLGVPLVGVGLLYQEGYFSQYLNAAGWQQESYADNDFENLPLTLQKQPDGMPVTVEIRYDGRPVVAQIWRADVGRVPLFLLDCNIARNGPDDRAITRQLYGGDREMRLKQEILLGIGGCRALEALGLEPSVYHMNEGHSAFLSLEWTRRLMEKHRLTFREARGVSSAGLIFTGHTPVPAGHDYFAPSLIARYLGDYARGLGLSIEEFIGLGRQRSFQDAEEFCMTVLALRMSASSNGVSKLHGRVSREMWKDLWPGVPAEEIPISHVTNGVHFRSWISSEMNSVYDRYLGPHWRENQADPKLWLRVKSIPQEELWRTHERRRERLVAFTRRRLRLQFTRRGAPQSAIDAADEVLDPSALTIGFARRFATYKRATLLLRDVDRLEQILNRKDRPVQILFAGKAHPQDNAGKALIQQIMKLAQRPEFRRRVVFLEDYDMAVARTLVQGCDVWLNTPLRPLEASGTSGMKAMANGCLNISTLDGWWDEAWRDANAAGNFVGWAIGRGETYENAEYQDQVEAVALYDLLESEIVPAFYERGADGLPRRWIAHMKSSIGSLSYSFNTQRMVKDYTTDGYSQAHERCQRLVAGGAERARNLAAWLERVERAWPGVRVDGVDAPSPGEIRVGNQLDVRARVRLGGLTAGDLAVELCLGRLNADGQIVDPLYVHMEPVGPGPQDGLHIFEARDVLCIRSGRSGYTVRIRPFHVDEARLFVPGLIRWAGDAAAQSSGR
ncbi:MAG TPA: alpha-glucan family phosphorylase [Candidatus Sulfopaludibacter sp.]|nr:alpha-glucan family phosphorylase [Candidatus Sulfopaludibacter sp.]